MARAPDSPTSNVNGLSSIEKWERIAKEIWLDRPASAALIKPETLTKKIWEPLEAEAFQTRSLAILESLQILEYCLWPTYTDDAPNQLVLLIAIFVGVKQCAQVSIWGTMLDRPDSLDSLFHRILSLNLDNTLSSSSKLALLSFIVAAFQSLEIPLIRKQCAPLVSVSIWQNLHSTVALESMLDRSIVSKRAWRAASKRYQAVDERSKARMRFDRSWLYTLLLDFFRRLNEPATLDGNAHFCERILEFLVDLASQLPTRRYTIALMKDLNLIAVLKLSRIFQDDKSVLIRDQCQLLEHFVELIIDDQSGASLGADARYDLHCQELSKLQRLAMRHFQDKLKVLALSNAASIARRSDLESHLAVLSAEELERICSLLLLRTQYPKQTNITAEPRLLLETLLAAFSPGFDVQTHISRFSTLPTEEDLYDPSLLRTEVYDGTRPLPIPKLNLQYLNLGDFLWRSFQLCRSEAFFEVRRDLEGVMKRMRPQATPDSIALRYDGFSKWGLPIPKPAIVEIGPAPVGCEIPAFVRAEIMLDMGQLNEKTRTEWDSLRPGDVVFLLSVGAEAASHPSKNEYPSSNNFQGWEIRHARAAEIVQLLDGNGRPLRDSQMPQSNGYVIRPSQRRLLVNLDKVAFKADRDQVVTGRPDIYSSINVLVRRNRRENNFKPMLDTMQSLVLASTSLPPWLRSSFLGYGDPQLSNYRQLSNKIQSVDYRDTFLDWDHLEQSFPGEIQPAAELGSRFAPPYVLQLFYQSHEPEPENPKKRRREQMEDAKLVLEPIKVSSYKPPNTGPYPMDAPRLNVIRFTPAQVQAITSGTQPGLSVIIGPPGTGKTDVATQIINLLYHNFPLERILLVAHSNQALNQLFQKIIALDIDSRHLLRLGHGEEDLDVAASYSKHGRVDSFMENRASYLAEVARLAASIEVPGAHGNSCETADYFNKVYIQPAWSRFWDQVHAPNATSSSIIECFPFHAYFSTAPNQPIFPPDRSVEDSILVAAGCEHHLSRIFSELESIRPFEILRQSKDQANYLLVKEARIIAMTSTHAAIRRSEIANLGFHYDTLIMEEAAQVTEIDSFIPCAMQNPDPATGELPLKRVVLVGDHLQNSPIIQNQAFRQYANLEQSLFLRLIRLGVPTITLDQQGRCRPSIARLFQWRYPSLRNLPHLVHLPEFKRANAGFRYDYQFIDVLDYEGHGEREPSAHFIQNLGEAEYAIALYQFMRLLGYPARSISILATYAGQRALIRDVLEHRCQGNRLFGLPRIVTTVDKYQGEQNDYIILSLTRTKSVGYLRDVRRLTVALSRARLGLYVLGRRDLFASSCFEMKPAMELFQRRSHKLTLVTGEMYPTERVLDEDDGDQDKDQIASVEMDGLEHLGQYVYEMTQAKIKASGGRVSTTENSEMPDYQPSHEEDGIGDVGLEDGEDDPLHDRTVS